MSPQVTDPSLDQKGGPAIDDTAEGIVRISVDTAAMPGRTLIDVGGELDMLTAPTLRETLLQYVDEPNGDVVVVLDAVEFMASTALGVLVEAAQHSKEAGSTLRLVCANRTVLRPLELTGLDAAFEILPSLEALDAG